MMVGAILTQATNWHNVEQAIERLKHAEALTPRALVSLPNRRLEKAIRPAGYFRQKARRLKGFAGWLVRRYGGHPARMFETPLGTLRQELLSQDGIGPETADSILLYGGGKPVFVIDAYTARVFRRHGLIGAHAAYGEVQRLVMQTFPAKARDYNEFHAVLVAVGKRFCHRGNPDCAHCPLRDLPHTIEVEHDGKR